MRGRSFSFVIRCEDVLTFVIFPGVSGSFSIIGVEMIIKSRNNNFTHTEAFHIRRDVREKHVVYSSLLEM